MQVALRPYLTSGVALVGASVIAVTPIAVSPPDIHLPALPEVHSAAVKLTAAFDPITAYINLLTNTLTNVGTLGGEALADPFPLLQQFLLNQVGNFAPISDAATGAIGNLINYLAPGSPGGLTDSLQQALNDLTQGNISTAFTGAVQAVFILPALIAALPVLSTPALLSIPVTMAQNFTNIVTALANPANLIGPAFAALGVALGQVNVIGDAMQEVLNSTLSLNPLGAVSALVATPGVLADALINGYTDLEGINFPGLLSTTGSAVGAGIVESVMTLAKALAQAITPAPTPPPEMLSAVASPTSKAAATVTLDVKPAAGTTDSGSAGGGSADAGTSAAKGGTESGGQTTDTGSTAGGGTTTDAGGTKGTDGTTDAGGTKGTDGTTDAGGTKGTDGTTDAGGTKDADGAKGTDGTKDADGTKGTDGAKDTDGTKDADKKADAKADSKSGDSNK